MNAPVNAALKDKNGVVIQEGQNIKVRGLPGLFEAKAQNGSFILRKLIQMGFTTSTGYEITLEGWSDVCDHIEVQF